MERRWSAGVVSGLKSRPRPFGLGTNKLRARILTTFFFWLHRGAVRPATHTGQVEDSKWPNAIFKNDGQTGCAQLCDLCVPVQTFVRVPTDKRSIGSKSCDPSIESSYWTGRYCAYKNRNWGSPSLFRGAH